MVDGPAAGRQFLVRRAPIWLRVARNRETGEWDVLNFIDDLPTSGEEIYVYRKQPGTGGVVFVDGDRIRDRYQTGLYDYVAQADTEPLRDRDTWQAWVMEQPKAVAE